MILFLKSTALKLPDVKWSLGVGLEARRPHFCTVCALTRDNDALGCGGRVLVGMLSPGRDLQVELEHVE